MYIKLLNKHGHFLFMSDLVYCQFNCILLVKISYLYLLLQMATRKYCFWIHCIFIRLNTIRSYTIANKYNVNILTVVPRFSVQITLEKGITQTTSSFTISVKARLVFLKNISRWMFSYSFEYSSLIFTETKE